MRLPSRALFVRRGALAVVAITAVVACDATRESAANDFEPRDAGTLIVAAELPAPGFWNGETADTVTGGFEHGLAQALADAFDLQLEVVEVPFTDVATGQLGPADLALEQVSITDERDDVVDFSFPYGSTEPAILARRDADETLDLATARDRTWAVQRGTTEEAFLVDDIRPDDAPTIVAELADIVAAVRDGRVDAGLIDLPSALAIAAENDGLTVVARFDRDERYGVVLPKGSDNITAVDQAIRRFVADGTLDDLANRWLDPVYATDPDDLPVIATR